MTSDTALSHLARTSAPMLGMQPASTAKTKFVQTGASARTHNRRAPIEITLVAAAGIATRAWPCRSTNRDTWGLINATASVNVAETAPASAKSPCTRDSIVMMPMPVIESGILARNPAMEKPTAPGAEKSRT